MFRKGALCLAFTLLATCGPERSAITWRLIFADSSLEARAVSYSAQIRSGTCSSTESSLLYDEDFRGDQGPPVPTLRSGTYAFSAIAMDRRCVSFAEGCEQVTLPVQGDPQVVVLLHATDELQTCIGTCINGECYEHDSGVDADIEDADIEDADVDPDDADIEEETFDYAWYVSDGCVGGCNVPCGGGTCPLEVFCERDDGLQVDDSYCSNPRPADTEPCNTHPCCSTDHTAMEANQRCSGGTSDIITWVQFHFGRDDGSLENRLECAEACTDWASGSYTQWCCDLGEDTTTGTSWSCAAHETASTESFTHPDSHGGYAVIGSCE